SHEPFIATVRFWFHQGLQERMAAEIETRRPRGYDALAVMERHLAGNDFFVGDAYGIADIALFAYTHVAHEGGFDLAPYPEVRAWIERVQAQPRHVPITRGQA
ncbi:MAG: glutathione binding-like protein, partial [Myxococcota bacterium]